jgi:hypothetical protein
VEERLEMAFRNAGGNRVTISVLNPKEGLTPAEVKAVMENILAANIFTSNGGDLTEIIEARIITRTVQELALA